MTSTPTEPDRHLDWSLLETVMQLSPDAALAVDSAGTIRAVNRLATDLFGYEAGDLVGSELEILLPERFRAGHGAHRDGYSETPRSRRMGVGLDLWGRRKDGSEFPVDISLAPLAGSEGVATVAAVRDMSERRRDEAARAQLAAIVESTDDAVISSTVDGIITSWNPGAERLLGYSADEIVGRPTLELVPDSLRSELAASRQRIFNGERVEPYETHLLRKDGSIVDVEVRLSIIRDRLGRTIGISGAMRDITARRKARTKLLLAQQEHEELLVLSDRDRIARDLHDLVIQRIFAAGMALQATANRVDDPDVAERISGVMDQLDRTIAEIRSTIFGLEQHRPTSMRQRVLEMTRDAAGSLGHEPKVHFAGPVDSAVPGQIMDNVLAVLRESLSNVSRHAGATATEVELCVDDDVVLRVTDNGKGISDTRRSSGLRNIRERATALGGTLRINGSPRGGTELEWRVPLAEPA